MKPKLLIMTCLVVTALMAALDLSNLLPGWANALIILGGGSLIAYLLALKEQGRKTADELRFILNAQHSLNNGTSEAMVVERLKDMLQKQAGTDKVYFSSRTRPVADSALNEKMIAAIEAWVAENKRTFLWPNPSRQLAPVFEGEEIAELMALPLQPCDPSMGIMYIYSCSALNLHCHYERAERLTRIAADAIRQHRRLEAQHAHDFAIIKAMVNCLDEQEPFFAGHSERVAAVCALVAQVLNLSPDEAIALKYGALLHDVGKLTGLKGSPETGGLQHTVQGAGLLPPGEFFIPIKECILSHHERYDGQGYPQGLSHNDIPFLARIIAVADMYDALVRLSQEENRLSHEQALYTIKKATGTLFDPLVVVALEEVQDEVDHFYKNN